MATFSIAVSFTTKVKDHDKANALADRIGNYVVQDKMASDYTVIDVELLDDDEAAEELGFNEDDE